MCPRLFTIGPIPIYSFGLMMGLGFFIASLVLHKETVRRNLLLDFSPELLAFLRSAYSAIVVVLVISYLIEHGMSGLSSSFDTSPLKVVGAFAAIGMFGYVLFSKQSATWVTADTAAFIVVTSIVAGVAGSKLLYLLENLPHVTRTPFETIFSPGGLTWYGGFLLVTIVIFIFTKRKGIPFLQICDLASPALMIGYGIARIGCHLSGDGDYGMPTDLPWASVYSNGTYPPSIAFRDFPEIVQRYGVNGVVPDTIPVHPAPLYEFILAVIMFGILWKFKSTLKENGKIFMLYLILAGSARLSVEFIRLNPRLLLGLTEAQLFSVIMIIIGCIGFVTLGKSSKHNTGHSAS